uniref:Putative kunitz-type protease inhibitor (inferred by orthology to a S. mansoni protein) n=1 Tax=Anisakis simplex TaxID=6269 RepID=A0A0M3IZ34_ANISI
LRYFYDKRADVCRLFYYSGCNGNSNNFATQYECEQRCRNAPVLCGNQTDSFGCPGGYYCRMGPPDVCCPNDEIEAICPDGSDPLLDQETGIPVKCGAGFDGHSLCAIGFYCSIDAEHGWFCTAHSDLFTQIKIQSFHKECTLNV